MYSKKKCISIKDTDYYDTNAHEINPKMANYENLPMFFSNRKYSRIF